MARVLWLAGSIPRPCQLETLKALLGPVEICYSSGPETAAKCGAEYVVAEPPFEIPGALRGVWEEAEEASSCYEVRCTPAGCKTLVFKLIPPPSFHSH